MSGFTKRLKGLNPDSAGRSWIYLPYDQVTDRIGPLSRENPDKLGIILVENPWKAARRPYHKQKLAFILANLRHFALEQAERGVAVRHIVANGPYRTALAPLASELGEIRVMEPAERELREDLSPLVKNGLLKVIPHEGWLTSLEDLEAARDKNGQYRMDAFYRAVRIRTGILMDKGKPSGGKYSFDAENRQPWRGAPPPPIVPRFAVDEISEEVAFLIDKHFEHPGKVDFEHLPVSQKDADRLWQWAKAECLPHFGPFEDAMSERSSGLFHSRISLPLNIMRLLPRQIVDDVLSLDIPLASKEGFIRQVLGWREFMHKMHCKTDGFRTVSKDIAKVPGDAGFKRWSGKQFKEPTPTIEIEALEEPDGGACPNFLEAKSPLPPAFWGKRSGLNCLDSVVKNVWREAYSHHITRLMVLSNIATLLDVTPRELTDWFWVAYADAYDWVVEPNVLAMGTFALGELMTTKPYISGAAYINKMSDYCRSCRFSAKDCPVTNLYWAFLDRHEEQLKENQRLFMPLNSVRKRDETLKAKDRRIFETMKAKLAEGEVINLSDSQTSNDA